MYCGAACANLPQTFSELSPTNLSNMAIDGNTRLNRLQGGGPQTRHVLGSRHGIDDIVCRGDP